MQLSERPGGRAGDALRMLHLRNQVLIAQRRYPFGARRGSAIDALLSLIAVEHLLVTWEFDADPLVDQAIERGVAPYRRSLQDEIYRLERTHGRVSQLQRARELTTDDATTARSINESAMFLVKRLRDARLLQSEAKSLRFGVPELDRAVEELRRATGWLLDQGLELSPTYDTVTRANGILRLGFLLLHLAETGTSVDINRGAAAAIELNKRAVAAHLGRDASAAAVVCVPDMTLWRCLVSDDPLSGRWPEAVAIRASGVGVLLGPDATDCLYESVHSGTLDGTLIHELVHSYQGTSSRPITPAMNVLVEGTTERAARMIAAESFAELAPDRREKDAYPAFVQLVEVILDLAAGDDGAVRRKKLIQLACASNNDIAEAVVRAIWGSSANTSCDIGLMLCARVSVIVEELFRQATMERQGMRWGRDAPAWWETRLRLKLAEAVAPILKWRSQHEKQRETARPAASV